jgi:phosphotransferase system IIB component
VQDSTVLNETTVYKPSVETNGLVQVDVIIGTAFAGEIKNELSAVKANGIPEKIAKVKRANKPLKTLRIESVS